MGNRRKARELAMQALFSFDVCQDDSEIEIQRFLKNYTPSEQVLPFFQKLITGVLENRKDLDKLIETYSNNWKISRMSCVDRNILRVAIFEMIHLKDIPPKVSINEAIDIGKKFGTDDSGSFINGILDSIHGSIKK
jgi:transcription antitermination protein NusB